MITIWSNFNDLKSDRELFKLLRTVFDQSLSSSLSVSLIIPNVIYFAITQENSALSIAFVLVTNICDSYLLHVGYGDKKSLVPKKVLKFMQYVLDYYARVLGTN